MKKIIWFSFLLLTPTASFGQSFDIHPTKSNYDLLRIEEKKDVDLTLLNQANLLATSSVTKVRVNALKYYLGIGDDNWIPFYILTTNPTKTEKKLDNTIDSLLDPEGGVLNLNVGYDKKLIPGGLFKFKSPQEGLFVYINSGAKLVEGVSEIVAESEMFWIAYLKAELKLQLPLGEKPISTTNRVGGLKLGLDATANHAFGDGYMNLFTERPERTFYNLNGVASFWLTNRMYITVGGTLASSEKKIDKRSYVSISFSQ